MKDHFRVLKTRKEKSPSKVKRSVLKAEQLLEQKKFSMS